MDIAKYYHPESEVIWVYGGFEYPYEVAWSVSTMTRADAERIEAKATLSPEEYEIWLEEWLEEYE